MYTFLILVHILACFALMVVILMQSGKGADMGATFGGGSSQTLFGSRGAASFLTKATAVIGALFMLTSLGLAVISGSAGGSSVVREDKSAPAQSAPAQQAPAQQPGAPATPGQAAPSPFQQAPAQPSPAAPAQPAPAPQGGK